MRLILILLLFLFSLQIWAEEVNLVCDGKLQQSNMNGTSFEVYIEKFQISFDTVAKKAKYSEVTFCVNDANYETVAIDKNHYKYICDGTVNTKGSGIDKHKCAFTVNRFSGVAKLSCLGTKDGNIQTTKDGSFNCEVAKQKF